MNDARPTPVALLVGFDRCGSSLIARLLAEHPRVNLLFQPFNSTEVTHRQWEPWTQEASAPETERFIAGLLSGVLVREYIASDWFDNHSKVPGIVAGSVHIVKDTKLHLKLPWLRAKFPELAITGLYRDPRAIVCSLARNGFDATWYGGDAFARAVRVAQADPRLRALESLAGECDSSVRRMAFMVAVRTAVLFADLDYGDWLSYEQVLVTPNLILNRYLARFGLESFDFAPGLRRDHNVIGKAFEREDLFRSYFADGELAFMTDLFARMGLHGS